MKETIYTIPINEAFDKDCECPVCEFLKNDELQEVEYALGASMMEPDERIMSNEFGYCQRHSALMYAKGNRLSHALILQTRIEFLSNSVDLLKKSVAKAKKPKIFKKYTKDISELQEFKAIENTACSCVICKKMDNHLERFIKNLFVIYTKDDEFKTKFLNSKGFCIKHFYLLLQGAFDNLKADELSEFSEKLCNLQKNNLDRMYCDVEWFTKKFDYRYKDEEWKNSKDAVERGCLKISGFIE